MQNQIILLALSTYAVILTVGLLLNKYLKLPWMFTVVVWGIVIASLGLFKSAIQSEGFAFLSSLGMLFFLFTIGLDLNLNELKKLSGLIILGNIALTLTEGLVLGLFFYFVTPEFVSNSFLVAILTGVAFGTVGEVILQAILKEFGVENTRFGQLALGVGILDDIFELLALAIIIALPAITTGQTGTGSPFASSVKIVSILAAIILATFILAKLGSPAKKMVEKISKLNDFGVPFFLFLVFFAFLYFSSSEFNNLGVIAAIFGGVAIKEIVPANLLAQYKKPIFFVARIFLGPFFFLKLGSGISFSALLSNPWLVLIIILISLGVRISISYLLFRKTIGSRPAVVLGIGLCAKFSTSVVSENLLFTTGMVAAPLYSAIMVAFILMKPIIIGTFSANVALIQDQLQPATAALERQSHDIGEAIPVAEGGD